MRTEIRKFPFGVTYQHWPDPSITKEERVKDLQNIAEYELNHVWYALHWAKVEKEQGKYDFDEIDERIKLAKNCGLKVHLVLEGYRGGEEGYPPTWLLRNKDDIYVKWNGESTDTMAPRKICLNHPVVRERVKKFFEAVGEHFAKEDAILLYNIHWEPGFICKCDNTMIEYVKWLKTKYGSIENFKKAWSAPNVDKWEDIVDCKIRFGLGFPYATSTLDWGQFCLWNLANIIKDGADALRSKDTKHPVLTHPVLSMIPSPYLVSNGVDDWLLAKSVDILGTSLYPTIPWGRGPLVPSTQGWFWAQILDDLRCAAGEKPFYIAELQTHYRSRYHPTDRMSPEQLSMIIWMCVAHGAKGITMWKWRPFLRGFQLSGRGITHHDGTPTDRAEIVKKIGAVLRKNSEIFLGMKTTRSEVAILFNPIIFLKLISLLYKPESVEYSATSLYGFYKALWENQIPVDFIRNEDIRSGKLTQYKVLFMPFALSLDNDIAEKLVSYVQNGGVLVADSPCAVTDDFENNCYQIMPGAGLDKLFKCKEIDLHGGQDVSPSQSVYSSGEASGSGIALHITDPGSSLPGILPETSFSGSLYEEELQVLPGGKIVGTFDNGLPAIVSSVYGNGSTIFVGTCLGRSYFKYSEEQIKRIIASIVKFGGVTKHVEVTPNKKDKPFDVVLHEHGNEKIIFLINLNNEPVTFKVSIKLSESKFSCIELINDQNIQTVYHDGLLNFITSMQSLETNIFLIKPY